MMHGTVLVCLLGSMVLPSQDAAPNRSTIPGSYEFDLLGRFNPENREQRLEQYKAIRMDVERAGCKLSWSEEEARNFASERGLSFVHGVAPLGRENDLTLSPAILGAVLWKEGSEPPAKGKVVRVEVRLITGGDDKELLRRFRNTRTLLQDQGFQEAYGYDHNHFQRMIGSLPAEKLGSVLRGLNKEAAGKNADFAPVALLITGEEASFSPEMKPIPPEGILRKVPPDSRSVLGEMAVKEGARPEGEGNQPGAAQPSEQASSKEPVRLEVVLNRVVPLTVGEDTVDLPWWSSLGEGAILEGRIGPLLSVRVTPEQARKIAQQADVAVVRLPREAVRVPAGSSQAEFPKPVGLPLDLRANIPGARPDFRTPLVVVVHDDFRGWETRVPRAHLLDLTRERNSLFLPDPVQGPGDGVGDGTRMAGLLAERSGGTRIILARIDPKSPAMLGRILQAIRGGALQDGLLGSRATEVATELARLNGFQQQLLDEQESLFLNAEGDTEAVVLRKGEVREALEKTKAKLVALSHLDREMRLHRGHLLELSQASVVLSGLAWAEGHPLDGSAVLSRYLDDALGKKVIWFQAAPDLSAMVWTGTARDANHNRLLEFDSRVAVERAHGAEFLPLVWGQEPGAKVAGASRTLSAPATIRLTLQWRESVRAELVQNYPQFLEEPIQAMRLLVVRKGNGEGADTLWTPVGTADGVAQKILQEPHSATWEQQVTLTMAEPGEYAIQVEGSPPRNTMPDQLGATPGSTFTPVTPMRILCRTVQGAPVSLAYRGLDPFDTPGWLPVPAQARRAMTVATRPSHSSNPALALEPDRRPKPEMVVPATGGTQVLEAMAEAGAEVVRKMGRGDSPELLDWVMHRRLGWIPAAGRLVAQPASEKELGLPTPVTAPR